MGSAFADVRESLGPIGILVTSAAIAGFTRFDKITLDEWNRYLAVNLTGTFLSSGRRSRTWWRPTGDASSPFRQPPVSRELLGQGHYAATKGGVIAMTKTVALDYAAKGITANTVPPFVIDTPMLREQQPSRQAPAHRISDQGHSRRTAGSR